MSRRVVDPPRGKAGANYSRPAQAAAWIVCVKKNDGDVIGGRRYQRAPAADNWYFLSLFTDSTCNDVEAAGHPP